LLTSGFNNQLGVAGSLDIELPSGIENLVTLRLWMSVLRQASSFTVGIGNNL
jgi:hypothetical protein